jgi:cbb3-type cytochrome oxidase subunit 3
VLLKIVIAILPFVIVFGGIALLILLFMRFFKKRNKKNLQNYEESHIIEKDDKEQ